MPSSVAEVWHGLRALQAQQQQQVEFLEPSAERGCGVLFEEDFHVAPWQGVCKVINLHVQVINSFLGTTAKIRVINQRHPIKC